MPLSVLNDAAEGFLVGNVLKLQCKIDPPPNLHSSGTTGGGGGRAGSS